MPDCSVYVTVINKTRESLMDGTSTATRHVSKWNSFPLTISPSSSATFELTELAYLTGTQGTFTYTIRDSEKNSLGTVQTDQADPYNGENKVSYTTEAPAPSMYNVTYRTRVANGEWKSNTVDLRGHPVHVEYTLDYQTTRRYRFQITQITAFSKHPIRNSRKELIMGNHILWTSSDPDSYEDGDKGSFQPNIFAYDFDTQVAATGILNVDVEPVDPELFGAEVMLYGTSGGNRVIQSDRFLLKPMTILAHITNPDKKAQPFSWYTDIDWGMEISLSGVVLQRYGPGVSRLELYFIAKTIYPALESYIPVKFLRGILPALNETTVQVPPLPFFTQSTLHIFNDFNKIYDTVSGVHGQGADIGTTFRYVNCMDQAAALQVAAGVMVFAATTWILHRPFGFINPTKLVGVGNDPQLPTRPLIDVNNPFFGMNRANAMVDAASPNRTEFYCHVFNGHSRPWVPATDPIYDACSGPSLGAWTMAQYAANVIDQNRPHGNWQTDAIPGAGVVTIDYGHPVLALDNILLTTQRPIPESLSQLVNVATANDSPLQVYEGWPRLPSWLKATLGESWDIEYELLSTSGAETRALWVISNTNSNDHDAQIRVNVNVASVSTTNRHLDVEKSAIVVRNRVSDILMSTQTDNIWVSDALPGLDGVCLHYADHVEAGRIVFAAGNLVLDTAGLSSTEALLQILLKLLNQTVRRDLDVLSSPAIPVLERQAIRLGISTGNITTVNLEELEAKVLIITVTGLYVRFSVVFSVSCKVASAKADCDGNGIVFDRYIVHEVDDGEGCIVEFILVTREIGRHLIRVAVADFDTMIGGLSDVEVDVVDAEEALRITDK
ncbi:hypothetical protein H0H93_003088 [Arthromyces matolae]|nr:hypothetical protein H0H93_003088 [Arthromyces matolae]